MVQAKRLQQARPSRTEHSRPADSLYLGDFQLCNQAAKTLHFRMARHVNFEAADGPLYAYG